MDPNWVKVTKYILKQAAGIGITILCSALAGSVAANTNAGPMKKLALAIGGVAIGGMLAKQSETYIDGEVDRAVESMEQLNESIRRVRDSSNGEVQNA